LRITHRFRTFPRREPGERLGSQQSWRGKNRLEAFSDGVIAIMVLELKVPHGADFPVLIRLWPVFMSYVLSFIYVGIYWNKLQYENHPSHRDG
jgi:uncharacterized membrane protein